MESQDEALFIQGYNNGYLLAKFEPTLIAKVLERITPTTAYISGLVGGQRQHQIEQRSRELDELSRLRARGKYFDRDIPNLGGEH